MLAVVVVVAGVAASSVSIPGELAEAVRKRVGARGLSGFVARAVAHELEREGVRAAHAIDAFVVATALQFDTAVIAAADPKDIQRLAAPFSKTGVFVL